MGKKVVITEYRGCINTHPFDSYHPSHKVHYAVGHSRYYEGRLFVFNEIIGGRRALPRNWIMV